MRIAKVVGNVVSTIKDESYHSYKLMIVEYLEPNGTPAGPRQIVFDGAGAGVGDIVLVCVDGGAVKIIINNDIIGQATICVVLARWT